MSIPIPIIIAAIDTLIRLATDLATRGAGDTTLTPEQQAALQVRAGRLESLRAEIDAIRP